MFSDLRSELRSGFSGLWIAMFAFVGFACTAPSEGDPFPAGAYVAGRVAALKPLLKGLQSLVGTSLAYRAFEIESRLSDCEEFAGAASTEEGVEALWDRLACARLADQPAAVRKLQADADLVFLAPVGRPTDASNAPSRLIGTVRSEPDGTLRLNARFDPLPSGTLGSLLVPSSEGAGPPRLNPSDTLVHGRIRPDSGLDIASLVPQGSQGDSMFKLKSQIFSSAILDGSLEFAIYLPEAEQMMPPIVIAVGTRVEAAAVKAMDAFIADISRTWKFRHVPARFGEYRGVCMVEMQLLPEFDPCYAAAKGMILIGWNRRALLRALEPGSGLGPATHGGVVVHLNRFAAADSALHAAWVPNAPLPQLDYAWQTLQAQLQRVGDEVHLQLVLEGRP